MLYYILNINVTLHNSKSLNPRYMYIFHINVDVHSSVGPRWQSGQLVSPVQYTVNISNLRSKFLSCSDIRKYWLSVFDEHWHVREFVIYYRQVDGLLRVLPGSEKLTVAITDILFKATPWNQIKFHNKCINFNLNWRKNSIIQQIELKNV